LPSNTGSQKYTEQCSIWQAGAIWLSLLLLIVARGEEINWNKLLSEQIARLIDAIVHWLCFGWLLWKEEGEKISLCFESRKYLIDTIIDWHYQWLLAEQRETVTIHFSWEVVNQHNCWLALPVDCWETKEKGVPFVLSWEVVYWHICWLVELVNCWESKKKRVPFILNFILLEIDICADQHYWWIVGRGRWKELASLSRLTLLQSKWSSLAPQWVDNPCTNVGLLWRNSFREITL